MSLLVKPLAPYMLLAVFLGVTGFLCAIYIPYFSALLISHIAIQAPDFPVSVFFVITVSYTHLVQEIRESCSDMHVMIQITICQLLLNMHTSWQSA